MSESSKHTTHYTHDMINDPLSPLSVINCNLAILDVDECKNSPCGSGSLCTNLPGSYSCSCPAGYIGNPTPKEGCIDQDECLTSAVESLCGQSAECVNTPGSYFCQCPAGFTGNPKHKCEGLLLQLAFNCLKLTEPCLQTLTNVPTCAVPILNVSTLLAAIPVSAKMASLAMHSFLPVVQVGRTPFPPN